MKRYAFTRRAPMTYRHTLRLIPKSLRRQWWTMRFQFDEPRVEIGRQYAGRLS